MLKNVVPRLILGENLKIALNSVFLSTKTCHGAAATAHNLKIARHIQTAPHLRRKLYVESENTFVRQFLPPLDIANEQKPPPGDINTVEKFEQCLEQDWRRKSAVEIVEAFEMLAMFAKTHEIPVSDRRFDKLVDGLMDNCEKLSDEGIIRLLKSLAEYPPCDGVDAHNFHDIWSCLDDICCWKMGDWRNQTTKFQIADLWYNLNLARISDYCYEVLDRLPKKAKILTKNELLWTFFYHIVCRKRQIHFDLEHALKTHITTFTIDELGVVALAYFKTQSKIKPLEIVQQMIKKLDTEYKTVNEITLAAILKTLRYTGMWQVIPQLDPVMDKISTQIDRLSDLCCLQVALIGVTMQYCHHKSLEKAALKLFGNLENLRLKDIERILLACTMYDVTPCTDFYPGFRRELEKPTRRREFVQYKISLPASLSYLSQKEIYSYKLMSEILDDDFINETFGKSARVLPRDLLVLDCSIDIECLDYQGARLQPPKKYRGAKWIAEFAPDENQYKRLTLSDKFYLDIRKNLVEICGGEKYVNFDHVLPHFVKADLVVCKNRNRGIFVEPNFGMENYVLGDVKKPPKTEENLEWFVFVGLIPNISVRGTGEPLGALKMKKRQLEKIGYTPIFIKWMEYGAMTAEERKSFILHYLKC